jgi:hypothetical protein
LPFVATAIVVPAAAELDAGLVDGLALPVEELELPHAATTREAAINSIDFMHADTEPGYGDEVTRGSRTRR